MEDMNKELAFIGLGKMGAGMSARLVEQDFVVHGYDVDEKKRTKSTQDGVKTYPSLIKTIEALPKGEKVIWLMIPPRFVDEVIVKLIPLLKSGDTIIDGGNSFFQETIRRNTDLDDSGIEYIDCGTSGGVTGARHGASLMIGASDEAFQKNEHIFTALASQNGYGHVGEVGAGHFVKMVHTGIEYGMMGAIAEGVNVLDEHKEGLKIDISEALKPFEHGSIIESNLISWLAGAYKTEGFLEHIADSVPIGETEMEMEYLIEHEDVLVLDAAVTQRKKARDVPTFIGTLIAAMRNQFGGHTVIAQTKENYEKKGT